MSASEHADRIRRILGWVSDGLTLSTDEKNEMHACLGALVAALAAAEQRATEAEQRAAELVEHLATARDERDERDAGAAWQYEIGKGWKDRCDKAEAERDRLAAFITHVVNDSPGTPGSVKQFLRAALAGVTDTKGQT